LRGRRAALFFLGGKALLEFFSKEPAAMDVWLHEQIMRKPAENGGKLPDDLKHD
jgi:hypothetical protein